MAVRSSGATNIGKVRTENQDFIHIDDDAGLYAVCDGMGGPAAGGTAATHALKVIAGTVQAERETQGSREELLKTAVNRANRALHERSTTEPGLHGMGCTATVLLIEGDRAHIAHAGDTRLYLVREGETSQLTTDHTVATAMASAGLIAPEEVRTHPQSNILMRALGPARELVVETRTVSTRPGDLFVLCSDGLTRYVENPAEVSTAADQPIEKVPAALIELANRRGGKDNIAVIAVKMAAEGVPRAFGVD